MLFGLGVGDVGAVFGTTKGLASKYGDHRVFDIPLSENAVTGMALGLSMRGFKPIMIHQRADFSFTSAEQIINQIAKANYMSNDSFSVSMVIRMIVGRGWGQGPTHAQSPHSLYSGIPGLSVVAPSSPSEGYALMTNAVNCRGPVIYIEHRWLHQTIEEFDPANSKVDLGAAQIVRQGRDLTLISLSYGVLECLNIAKTLSHFGIDCEVISLRSVRPLDSKLIIESVKKTRRAVFWDIGHIEFGISGEISKIIYAFLFPNLLHPVLSLGLPDEPTPSSPILAAGHYVNLIEGMLKIAYHFSFDVNAQKLREVYREDFPDKSIFGDQPDIGEVGPF
jgi:pyruvate dehydrogenase E1 component beta subunit